MLDQVQSRSVTEGRAVNSLRSVTHRLAERAKGSPITTGLQSASAAQRDLDCADGLGRFALIAKPMLLELGLYVKLAPRVIVQILSPSSDILKSRNAQDNGALSLTVDLAAS